MSRQRTSAVALLQKTFSQKYLSRVFFPPPSLPFLSSFDNQKLLNRVSSPKQEKEKEKPTTKEPQIRTVRGTFQLDITSSKPPDHILQEINKALQQSKIEVVNEGFVYHCVGKVNVKGKGDEPVTSYPPFLFIYLIFASILFSLMIL